jgi:hypothetical protein
VVRLTTRAHTARGLGEQEGVIGAYVESIRGEFNPADTALVTELGNPRSYPWFRHATYYLPDFAVYHLRLGPWSAGYLFSRQLDTMAAISDREIRLSPGRAATRLDGRLLEPRAAAAARAARALPAIRTLALRPRGPRRFRGARRLPAHASRRGGVHPREARARASARLVGATVGGSTRPRASSRSSELAGPRRSSPRPPVNPSITGRRCNMKSRPSTSTSRPVPAVAAGCGSSPPCRIRAPGSSPTLAARSPPSPPAPPLPPLPPSRSPAALTAALGPRPGPRRVPHAPDARSLTTHQRWEQDCRSPWGSAGCRRALGSRTGLSFPGGRARGSRRRHVRACHNHCGQNAACCVRRPAT